ncbi:PAS domain S-box protein [Niveibacterium sp. 24ML]|uniref:sensor histidine kinase n=1 Tax=Niveibacterium sp. 24ML TaxID=2985512 RepID=UPI00226E02B6|nr:PAS domain S-box protein [Niveibacterium sp. 24ML]MCX9157844.1 PAS domain S-box protein [Niveibacterium sp. 24ML]
MFGLIERLSRWLDPWTSSRAEWFVGFGGLAVVLLALFVAWQPFNEARQMREREALASVGRATAEVQQRVLRALDLTDYVLERTARRGGEASLPAPHEFPLGDLASLLGKPFVLDQARLWGEAKLDAPDALPPGESLLDAKGGELNLLLGAQQRIFAVRVWRAAGEGNAQARGAAVELMRPQLAKLLSVDPPQKWRTAMLADRTGRVLLADGEAVTLPSSVLTAIASGLETEIGSDTDGRLFGVRQLAQLPLWVVVALDAERSRSAVELPSRAQGMGLILLAVFVLAVTLMLMGATRSMRHARLRADQQAALFEASPDPMMLVRQEIDGGFICERSNPSARRIFGGEALAGGAPVSKLLAGETLRRALEQAARHRHDSQRVFNLSVPLARADAQVEIKVIELPASDDSRPRFAIIGRELTAQREAEWALRVRSLQMEAIIDSAMDAVLITDSDRRVVMYNKAAERMFGYTADEIIGQDVLRLLPERYRDVPAAKIMLQARRRASWRLRGGARPLLGCRADGDEFPVELALSRVELGDRTLYTLILRDITEQVGAELEINVLNASLEQRVNERTAELQRAYREMEAFSYSVSHDLRAPLRAIHGYTFLLQDGEGDRLSAEGRGLLDRVMNASVRMGELIDDFLDFSRIGRAELTRQKVDMGRLVAEVVADLRGPYLDVRVSVGLLPPAYGDPRLLRHVWSNLIGNALKFSSHTPEPRVHIGVTQRDGRAWYFVSDNGVGFDMNYADKLFGVFQRLHSSREFEGTGIGLAIVKRVVERHHGAVHAEGAPGQGATLSFWLP